MELQFEKIGDAIKTVGEKAVKTGKEYKDIISVRTEIATCKDLIERNYKEIGKKYYEIYCENNTNPEFEKRISEIKNAKKAIEDLEAKIEDIKANM